MNLHQETLHIPTHGAGLRDITAQVRAVLDRSGVRTGLCVVFVRHTSASLCIQENADPAVQRDLQGWMADLAPESRPWEHDDEGPDDMPAHARSVVTRSSESIPVQDGALALGRWQGIFLWEHRRRAQERSVIIHVQGEP